MTGKLSKNLKQDILDNRFSCSHNLSPLSVRFSSTAAALALLNLILSNARLSDLGLDGLKLHMVIDDYLEKDQGTSRGSGAD